MTGILTGKKILLGVTGSIAAFKAVSWASELRRDGAVVTVVMTGAGTRFVAPLTFAAVSGNRVYTDMFDPGTPEDIPHISLARTADLVLVAPATASTIARLANGQADDLLSTIVLATRAPVVVCPAMNSNMLLHQATQANLVRLREYGYLVVAPDSGILACGEEGPGRLPEWDTVREEIMTALSPADLQGRTVLVTAGPTREPLDPARFLSNPSTGKMGYLLARTARRRGAKVLLVSGPSSLPLPPGVEAIRVETATEMHEAVMARWQDAEVVVKSAAVADFRPAVCEAHKVKKEDAGLELQLVRTPDILKELAAGRGSSHVPLLVGFAAESRDHLAAGRRKLAAKNIDLLVVNDIGGQHTGFGADTNQVTLLDTSGAAEELPLLSKEETADLIWDRVAGMLGPQD